MNDLELTLLIVALFAITYYAKPVINAVLAIVRNAMDAQSGDTQRQLLIAQQEVERLNEALEEAYCRQAVLEAENLSMKSYLTNGPRSTDDG